MPKKRVTVTVDSKLLEKFKKYCNEEDKDYSKAVSKSIEEYMKKRGVK